MDSDDIKECLDDADRVITDTTIKRVGEMLSQMDKDDQIVWDVVRKMDIPERFTLGLMESVVDAMYADDPDKKKAERELHEMGLSTDLLRYIGFFGDGAYEFPNLSQEDVMNNLRNVVYWLAKKSKSKETTRSKLKEMGFSNALLKEIGF